MHHAEDVGGHVPLEGGRISIGQRSDGVEHSGVVDPQVDPPEAGHYFVGQPIHCCGIAHVERGHQGVGARWRLWPVATAQPEPEPATGEVDGQSGPEAAGRSGDHRHRSSAGIVTVEDSHDAQSTVETNTFLTSV